jgi:hypothetical protein
VSLPLNSRLELPVDTSTKSQEYDDITYIYYVDAYKLIASIAIRIMSDTRDEHVTIDYLVVLLRTVVHCTNSIFNAVSTIIYYPWGPLPHS